MRREGSEERSCLRLTLPDLSGRARRRRAPSRRRGAGRRGRRHEAAREPLFAV